MVEITLKLPEDARRKVLETLREELVEMEGRAVKLRDELRSYEEKYGLSSQELVELWEDAVENRGSLPLPDDADLDLIGWRALYTIYTGLLGDIEEVKESIERLRAA